MCSRDYVNAEYCFKRLHYIFLLMVPCRWGAHLSRPPYNSTSCGPKWRGSFPRRLLPLSAPSLPNAHLWAWPLHCCCKYSLMQKKKIISVSFVHLVVLNW